MWSLFLMKLSCLSLLLLYKSVTVQIFKIKRLRLGKDCSLENIVIEDVRHELEV